MITLKLIIFFVLTLSLVAHAMDADGDSVYFCKHSFMMYASNHIRFDVHAVITKITKNILTGECQSSAETALFLGEEEISYAPRDPDPVALARLKQKISFKEDELPPIDLKVLMERLEVLKQERQAKRRRLE